MAASNRQLRQHQGVTEDAEPIIHIDFGDGILRPSSFKKVGEATISLGVRSSSVLYEKCIKAVVVVVDGQKIMKLGSRYQV